MERKVKLLPVPVNLALQLFTGLIRDVPAYLTGLPDDVTVLSCSADYERNALVLTLYSDTFDIVPDNTKPPVYEVFATHSFDHGYPRLEGVKVGEVPS